MSDLGAPSINISFIEQAKTAISRGSRGIVLVAVKDTFAATLKNPATVIGVEDIPSSLSDASKEQIKLALKGYINAPKKLLVYGMGIADDAEETAVDEAYTAAEKAWATIKFNYLAIPTVSTDGKVEEIATWVKTMRDNKKKRIKAVLPNSAADNEGVINYPIAKNVYTETQTQADGTVKTVDTEYNAEQYCARMAGLLAGTPMDISATYAPLPELSDCTRLEDLDEAVNDGKFVIMWDGEKVKTVRAVNSLKTTTAAKNDSFKKIKIVDAMDMIADDIEKTTQDSYIGKYPNTYDNKCVLITAIKGYFMQLWKDNIVTDDYTIDLDVDAIRTFALSTGKYTEDEIAEMSDDDIKKLDTKAKVFLTAHVNILDAMEDVDLPIHI